MKTQYLSRPIDYVECRIFLQDGKWYWRITLYSAYCGESLFTKQTQAAQQFCDRKNNELRQM